MLVAQLKCQPKVDVEKEGSKESGFDIGIVPGGRMLSIKNTWITFGALDVPLH